MAAPLLALIPAATSLLGGVLDMLTGNQKAQAEALIKQLDAAAAEVQGQIEINKVEAQHQSIFVAGWRPAIGWLCGLGVGYNVLIWPLLSWGSINSGWTPPPQLDPMFFGELLFGMLGISGMRSWEKYKGVAR